MVLELRALGEDMDRCFQIVRFDSVNSTNDVAFELAAQGNAFNHFLITANSQTNGRGRLERQWESLEGNLFFSLLLQFETRPNATDFTFLTACVVGNVLQHYGVKVQYKWPNDMMLEGKKLAGILLQLKTINGVDNLVIGVGVNLASAPDYAACLKDFGVTKEDFLAKFEEVFLAYEYKYQQFGFGPIRQEWKNNAFKIGSDVALSNGMKGVFEDIDAQGNLVLLGDDGVRVKAGVVEIL